MSPKEILLKARALLHAPDPLLDGEQTKEQEAAEKTCPCSLSSLVDSSIYCCGGHRAFKAGWRAGNSTPGSHSSSQHLPSNGHIPGLGERGHRGDAEGAMVGSERVKG